MVAHVTCDIKHIIVSFDWLVLQTEAELKHPDAGWDAESIEQGVSFSIHF